MRYRDVLNIYLIYINEAHASDIWPIGLSAGVINKSHKILNDRQRCAKNLIHRLEFKIHVYLDNMNNDFKKKFASWPFRAIIVKNTKIVYNSALKNSEYDIMDLYKFMNSI